MHPDLVVMRHSSPGACHYLARILDASIVNAGDGAHEHPTQALLDALTIRRHKGGLAGLTVAICGDIRHSRVARSTGWGLHTLGVGELRLISPPSMAPPSDDMPFAKIHDNLDDGLADADVVMALRIQRERISDLDDIPGTEEYFDSYGVSHARMKIAKPDAIVMHPGPMNRGIEIEGSLADSRQSVITEQVANGVAVRMAVLERVAKTLESR
jgi:aspartate carbamoyltransferase catalytic subunit